MGRRHSDQPCVKHTRPYTIEDLAMKINELLTVNQSIKGQLNKAEKEILDNIAALQAKIGELVDAATNADLPDDIVASINEVQTAAQALDDINADPV